MNAIIKDKDGHEFIFEGEQHLRMVRIKDGKMTINYLDENGEERQEISDIPEYMNLISERI